MHHHSTDIVTKCITLFHPGIAATATGTVTPRRLAWNMPRIHSPLLLSCHALTRALLVLWCSTGTFSRRCDRGASYSRRFPRDRGAWRSACSIRCGFVMCFGSWTAVSCVCRGHGLKKHIFFKSRARSAAMARLYIRRAAPKFTIDWRLSFLGAQFWLSYPPFFGGGALEDTTTHKILGGYEKQAAPTVALIGI